MNPTSMLAELAQYDSPTISNAIELFGLRPATSGYMDHRIRCCFEKLPPMVGYACTATFQSSMPTEQGGGANQACGSHEVADLVATFAKVPGPAVVVCQDLDDPPAAGGFGEVSCWTYKSFGAAGLITSGAGRDFEQVEALEFPVFCSASICSHGFGRLPTIGEPVEVGGLTIHPGDLIHGDRNGVVTIPTEIAPKVPAVAAALLESEQPVLEYLKNTPQPTVEGYRERIHAMFAFHKEIQAGLSKS